MSFNNIQHPGSLLQFNADEYNQTNFNDKFGTYRQGLSVPTNELHELSDDDNFIFSKFRAERQKKQMDNNKKIKK